MINNTPTSRFAFGLVQMKSHFTHIAVICIVLLFIVAYWQLPFTFYQQDEWANIGLIMSDGPKYVLHDVTLTQILLGRGRIGAKILTYIVNNPVFQFSILPSMLVAIIFHGLNCWLVFRFTKKITKHSLAAVIAAGFFGVNFISSQAITWSAALSTVIATTCILCSLLIYAHFLFERRDVKFIWLTGAFLFLSLLFKEIGIILFLLYPVFFLFFPSSETISVFAKWRNTLRYHWPLILYSLAIIGFTLIQLTRASATEGNFVTAQQHNMILSLAYHAVVYPLTSPIQILLPPSFLIWCADFLARTQHSFTISAPIVQTLVLDLVSALGTIFFLSIILFISFSWKNRKIVWFGLVFSTISFLPYVVVDRSYAFLESRYYYLGVIGLAIVLGVVIEHLWSWKITSVRFVIGLLICASILMNVRLIQQSLSREVAIAAQRKQIIATLAQLNLGNKKIHFFYDVRDQDYEVVHQKLPFQQGIGYTLLLVFYPKGGIAKKFLNPDSPLWSMGSQGYVSDGEYGFGYFYDLNMLKAAVASLSPDSYNLIQIDYYKGQLNTLPMQPQKL